MNKMNNTGPDDDISYKTIKILLLGITGWILILSVAKLISKFLN